MNASFVLHNTPSEIQQVLNKAIAFWRGAGLTDELINETRLSLEELLTNIVFHGFDNDDGHLIKIDMRVDDNILRIETQDDGKPFDPTKDFSPETEKPFDERDIGGFGITLIRNLMDELAYRRYENNNILTMKKRISPNIS